VGADGGGGGGGGTPADSFSISRPPTFPLAAGAATGELPATFFVAVRAEEKGLVELDEGGVGADSAETLGDLGDVAALRAAKGLVLLPAVVVAPPAALASSLPWLGLGCSASGASVALPSSCFARCATSCCPKSGCTATARPFSSSTEKPRALAAAAHAALSSSAE